MAGAPRIEPAIEGKIRGAAIDLVIAELADRQHGVVSRAQLLNAGVHRHAIAHRLERRRLRTIHFGVYAHGHCELTMRGRQMAAVLAAGHDAVLSHRSAGALWGIVRSDYLEVTAPRERRRPGIRIRESSLPPDETTIERGIPVTTVWRTLFDLAGVLQPIQLQRAMNEVEVRGLYDSLSVRDLLSRYPGRPGTPALRAILDQHELHITRSELEERFLDFIERHDLPRPETNAWLQIKGIWLQCDCVWGAQRLVVELDGYAFHGTRAAFQADRARDRRLQAAGWRVVRITWHQLQADPENLAHDLRAVLARPDL